MYADSDFSKKPDLRKSRTGFILYLNGAPIAWHSSLQKRVATSTSDAVQLASWRKVTPVANQLGSSEHMGILTNATQISQTILPSTAASAVSNHQLAYLILYKLTPDGRVEFLKLHLGYNLIKLQDLS